MERSKSCLEHVRAQSQARSIEDVWRLFFFFFFLFECRT